LTLCISSYNLQSQITREVERARNEELRLDRKIDDEIARAKSEEKRIETKLDKEIDRSTQEDQDIHDELDGIKEEFESLGPVKVADYGLRDNKVWVKFEFGLIIQFGTVWISATRSWELVSIPITFSNNDSFAVVASDVASYERNGAHVITAAGVDGDGSKIAIYVHSDDSPTEVGYIAVGY